jgi:hypothetical protein
MSATAACTAGISFQFRASLYRATHLWAHPRAAAARACGAEVRIERPPQLRQRGRLGVTLSALAKSDEAIPGKARLDSGDQVTRAMLPTINHPDVQNEARRERAAVRGQIAARRLDRARADIPLARQELSDRSSHKERHHHACHEMNSRSNIIPSEEVCCSGGGTKCRFTLPHQPNSNAG